MLFCLFITAIMIVAGIYGFYFSNSELLPYVALTTLVLISLALIIYLFKNKFSYV